MKNSFIYYIEHSIKIHWNHQALSDYKGTTYTYKEVAKIIEELHILFEKGNIRKGDKIALCSRNMSHWGIAFLAILSYGAVAVPILPTQSTTSSTIRKHASCLPELPSGKNSTKQICRNWKLSYNWKTMIYCITPTYI